MDYYAILEIKYGASQDEIKKAFHRLAHVHHPDKGGDVKKFQQINNAYQELKKNPHASSGGGFDPFRGSGNYSHHAYQHQQQRTGRWNTDPFTQADLQDLINRMNRQTEEAIRRRNAAEAARDAFRNAGYDKAFHNIFEEFIKQHTQEEAKVKKTMRGQFKVYDPITNTWTIHIREWEE